jgi:DNA-binding NtrC family response regulator
MNNDSPMNKAVDLLLDSNTHYQDAEDLLRARMLVRSLQRTHGNICHAAALIGMHRNNFTRELEKFGMVNVPGRIREARKASGLQMNLWHGRPATRSRSLRAA